MPIADPLCPGSDCGLSCKVTLVSCQKCMNSWEVCPLAGPKDAWGNYHSSGFIVSKVQEAKRRLECLWFAFPDRCLQDVVTEKSE